MIQPIPHPHRKPHAKLRAFLFHPLVEIAIGLLIVLSVGLTVLEVQAAPESEARRFYMFSGLAITGLFVVELFLRWLVSRSTKLFFQEYWIDCLAVLPPIRALRFMRVLRLLRLVRLGILITRRSKRSASLIQEGLMEHIILILVLLGVFLIGAFGMFVVERENSAFNSLSKSVWWSLFTLMAGEPIGGEASSFVGKIISAVVMLGGFTFFAVFTGVVSAVMVSRLRGRMEATEMELQSLEKHFIICGWNRSGTVVIKELQAAVSTQRCPIVIIAELEKPPHLPTKYVDLGLVHFVSDDYTSKRVLDRVRVKHARAAILLADKSKERSDQDRDARTILAALTIERMNPEIFTVAELLNRENKINLQGTRVEDVVVGDEYAGNIIAHSSRTWGLVSVLDELLTATRGNQFFKFPMKRTFPELVGVTVGEALMQFKTKYDAILVSVERIERDQAGGKTRKILTNPPSKLVLKKRDNVILIASGLGGTQR